MLCPTTVCATSFPGSLLFLVAVRGLTHGIQLMLFSNFNMAACSLVRSLSFELTHLRVLKNIADYHFFTQHLLCII